MIDAISANAGMIGLLFFFVIFMGIVIWAFLPRNKQKLESHAHIPLKEKEDVER